jgi:hypothetical protein
MYFFTYEDNIFLIRPSYAFTTVIAIIILLQCCILMV